MKDWTLEQREYAQRIKDMKLTEDEADEYLWNEYQKGHIMKRTYNCPKVIPSRRTPVRTRTSSLIWCRLTRPYCLLT